MRNNFIYLRCMLLLGIYSTVTPTELNTLPPTDLEKKYVNVYKRASKNPSAKAAFSTDRWKKIVETFLSSKKTDYEVQKNLFEELLKENSLESQFLLNFLIDALKTSAVETKDNPLLTFFRNYAKKTEMAEKKAKKAAEEAEEKFEESPLSVAFKKALDSSSLKKLLLAKPEDFKDALKEFFTETLPITTSDFNPTVPVECWMDSYIENKLESKNPTVVSLFDNVLITGARNLVAVSRKLDDRVLKYIYSQFKAPYVEIIRKIMSDETNPIKFLASLNRIATLCSAATQADKETAFESLDEESRRWFCKIYIKEGSLEDTEQSSYLKTFLQKLKTNNPDQFESFEKTLAEEKIESIANYAKLTDEELLTINELLKTPGVNIELDKIKNPLVKALAASQIIGKHSGTENDEVFVNASTTIADAVKMRGLSKTFFKLLAKQSVDSIVQDSAPDNTQVAETSLKSIGDLVKKSMTKRSMGSRLGSWFREYFNMSRLVLRARSAFMSDEGRYRTAMNLASDLQGNSPVDREDVRRSIGIVLQNLSGKKEVDGQPGSLLRKIAASTTDSATIIDEIINKIPNIPNTPRQERNRKEIGLREFALEQFNAARESSTSISITASDEAGSALTTIDSLPAQINITERGPALTAPAKTNTARNASGQTTLTTQLTDIQRAEQERRDEEKRKKDKEPILEEDQPSEERR